MDSKLKDDKLNTNIPNNRRGAPPERRGSIAERRQPHERDESPEGVDQTRGVMEQAAADLEQGLVDTDLHGTPGIDRGVRSRGPAQPLPNAGEGMRHQGTAPTAPRK